MNLQLENVTCDLCGSLQYHLRYRKPDNWLWINQFEYPVVECKDCGLVYINPRPTQESMKLFYPTDYHDKRETQWHQNRYQIQSEFLPILTNENILDIGCAKGDFLVFLKKKYPNISLFGMDIFSMTVNSDDIAFQSNTLNECNYKDSEFDIITAWAVFEHLHSPSTYFKESNRILKKGGKLIFLVTNANSLYGKRAFIEDIPRHIYHFSEKSLHKYASKYGFQMTKCCYDDRIWDGRGIGTFHYFFSSISGVTWERRYFKQLNLVQRLAGKIGNIFDRFVFYSHWEAKYKRSGIIVVEFTKMED